MLTKFNGPIKRVKIQRQQSISKFVDLIKIFENTLNLYFYRALEPFSDEESQTDLWQKARDKAIEAQEKAQEALSILKPIIAELPKELETAKEIPQKFDDINKDIAQANSQVERVQKLFPNLDSLTKDLSNKQDQTAVTLSLLGERIGKLKQQIETAREAANAIKVGVTFHPNTTLDLQPPPDVSPLSLSQVSAFFRTSQPNGFLLYLGNENKTGGKRNKREDFMAVEIENGYPILTIDLGNGPQKIISETYVADDKWHQIIVERTGNNVTLIVREETDDGQDRIHPTKVELQGTDLQFNIEPENCKLFVGGYPPDYNMQDGLKYSSFEGQIEDLRVGDQDVGLWNFIDGQDNNHGAVERDRLLALDKPENGYRFSGNGYVQLDSKPYLFKTRSSIQFKFKVSPDVTEGLIFYAGKLDHFISVEMLKGTIYFKYRLGEHMVNIGNQVEMMNDDQWHKVEAERSGRRGILKIDNRVVYQDETPNFTEDNLKITDHMYFGGYPGKLNHSEITNKHFDGCIKDVFIDGTTVDLSRNEKSHRVRSGCPDKLSRVISYPPRQFGYLRLKNISSANHFQVNLKFKTKQANGLIFYGSDNDQIATIGLSIRDGALVLNSLQQELSTEPLTFNDGEWHLVTATHDAKRLRLRIDDGNEFR